MKNNKFTLEKSAEEHYWSEYIPSLLDCKEILSDLSSLSVFPIGLDQGLLDFIKCNTKENKIDE